MDSKKNINIYFACDDNYAKYAGVSIASFLKNFLYTQPFGSIELSMLF